VALDAETIARSAVSRCSSDSRAPISVSSFFCSALIPACATFSSASAVRRSADSRSVTSIRSSSRSSCARTRPSAVAISVCIAWYSLFVFTVISWSLYFDSRPWTAATSFSTSRRVPPVEVIRSLTAWTAVARSASRSSSAWRAAGISAMRRRARSMAESISWRWMRC